MIFFTLCKFLKINVRGSKAGMQMAMNQTYRMTITVKEMGKQRLNLVTLENNVCLDTLRLKSKYIMYLSDIICFLQS